MRESEIKRVEGRVGGGWKGWGVGGGRVGEKEEKRDRTERRRREREWKERGGGYQSKAVPLVTST